MKWIAPFLLFISMALHCMAQDMKKLDSLMLLYHAAKHDSSRILALNSIAYLYHTSNPDTCILIAEKALEMSEQIDFEKGRGWALNRMGVGNWARGNYQEALKLFINAATIFEKINEKAGNAASLNNIGGIYLYQGDYPQALEYFRRSLKIREETGDRRGIAISMGNIGSIYLDQGDYLPALEYYQKSLKIYEELGDKRGIVTSLYNIGECYRRLGDYPPALEYYRKSLEIAEEIKEKSMIAYTLQGIGWCKLSQGDALVALEHLRKSLKMFEEIGDKWAQTYSLDALAQASQQLKNYDKSIDYAQKSLQIAQEIKATLEIKNASQTLYQTYKLKGDYLKALQYHELYKASNDSLFNADKSKAIANLEAKAEIERRELKFLKEKEAKEFQQYLNYLVLAGMILVLVFAYFIYRSRQKEKLAKEEIREVNGELQQTLVTVNEQKKLIQEKSLSIEDSIQYAQRIQQVILPLPEYMERHLPEYFVLFQPRDVVSGDFYYFEERNGLLFLAVIDCTGHGVPGAFMTMIASEILNEVIQNKGIIAPDQILNELHRRVRIALKQEETQNRDGMDLVLIVIDKAQKKVHFAGAKNPLVYIQEGELHQIKGDSMPIGGEQEEMERNFRAHSIDTSLTTTFYLFSDGYQDQFGGKDNKKFMSSRMRGIFLDIYRKEMPEQKEILARHIRDWMQEGNETQIDDITILGLRI